MNILLALILLTYPTFAEDKPWGDKYPAAEVLFKLREAQHMPVEIKAISFSRAQRGIARIKQCVDEYKSSLDEIAPQDYIFPGKLQAMSDTVMAKIPIDIFHRYKCLRWESRALAIPNRFISVEAYILKNREKVLRLELELAKLRKRPALAIAQLEYDHREARKVLEYFLATTSYND